RVVVMQPRPGRIKRIVDVPLRRPRDRASAEFVAIKDDVLSEFIHEINHATVAERAQRAIAEAAWRPQPVPRLSPPRCSRSACAWRATACMPRKPARLPP